MEKKILLLAAALMMFMGVVSASSINGDYKGNPIVKVMSNGKQLQSNEVPAMIYDGHTVVPISLLRQLGASVEWNADTYSVDVKMEKPLNPLVNIYNLRTDLLNEVSSIDYSIDVNGLTKLTFAMKFNTGPGTDEKYDKIINVGAAAGVDKLVLVDEKPDGFSYGYLTVSIIAVNVGTMSMEELRNKTEVTPKIKQSQIVTQPVQQQPQNQQPQPRSQEAPQPKLKVLSLYSNDGKVYLGKLTSNEFDSDSIYNEFGKYGSEFQSLSIFNEFGTYGGEFSSKSPFNQFTSTPPIIISDGKVVGYLTLNSFLKGAISPLGLKEWLKDNGY